MPRNPELKKNYINVGCEITREYNERIEDACSALGAYKSEFVRLAIRHYLEHIEEENVEAIAKCREMRLNK